MDRRTGGGQGAAGQVSIRPCRVAAGAAGGTRLGGQMGGQMDGRADGVTVGVGGRPRAP